MQGWVTIKHNGSGTTAFLNWLQEINETVSDFEHHLWFNFLFLFIWVLMVVSFPSSNVWFCSSGSYSTNTGLNYTGSTYFKLTKVDIISLVELVLEVICTSWTVNNLGVIMEILQNT